MLVQASYAMMLQTDIQATSKPSIALLRCQWTSSRNYTLRAEVSRDTLMSKSRLQKQAAQWVIPPFLAGCFRRTHAAIFSFIAGVMPPMPMLGRSLL